MDAQIEIQTIGQFYFSSQVASCADKWIEILDMMQDILDLQSMKMLMKNNEHIYFAGNLWCIEVESFGEINRWTLPKWIGDLLNDEA